MQDIQRGLKLSQSVYERLEYYPADKLFGSLGAELVAVVDRLASRQLELKQYTAAEELYQRALSTWLENKSMSSDEIKKRSASIYHQLGIIAEEQRQWPQAEQYYQQALQIKIEYNDRYEQARTYGQLGRMAQEQQQWQQASEYLVQALQIFVEYEDTYTASIVFRNLARLWKACDDANVRASIAKAFGKSVEETEKLLLEALGERKEEQIADSE